MHFTPFLLLLLSPIIAALPPLPLTPVDPLRSTHHVLNACLPHGNFIHGISSPIQCPCTATINILTSSAPSNLKTSTSDSLHLHVVRPAAQHQIVQTLQLSTSNAASRYFTIDHHDRFAFILETSRTSSAPDCATKVQLNFRTNRAEDTCEVALPETIGRVDTVQPRIVGGHVPHSSLRTHMAAFVLVDQFVCSGSVIGKRWVLTAAHCDINTQYSVVIGGQAAGQGEYRSIRRVWPHPAYGGMRQDNQYDLMLIELAEDVPEGTRIVKVNANNSVPLDGSYVRASGYGRTTQKSTDLLLRQVDVPVVPMYKCKRNYGTYNGLLARSLDGDLQLCAGLDEGGCDACHGDSGGPLVLFDSNNQIVQVGIVSFGIGCARKGLPGVYTKLSNFVDWLETTTGPGEFEKSYDGLAVFSTGSRGALSGGFSIAGLTQTQSILLLCGVVVVGVALLAFLVVPVARRLSSGRGKGDESSEPSVEMLHPPPPVYIDSLPYGGGGYPEYPPASYQQQGAPVIYDPRQFYYGGTAALESTGLEPLRNADVPASGLRSDDMSMTATEESYPVGTWSASTNVAYTSSSQTSAQVGTLQPSILYPINTRIPDGYA